MLTVINTPNSKEATTDACRVCAPLGAAVAFRGIENSLPLLHGSQGCSTYIRRYLISHFREPVDIASSNFHEQTAIFGGRDQLRLAIQNVVRQYNPSLIGVATTCLSETIGDDVQHYLKELIREAPEGLPDLVHVSTASYRGSHHDGFVATLRAIVSTLAKGEAPVVRPSNDGRPRVNLIGSLISPIDIRHLHDVGREHGIDLTVLPDYSETLDGPIWSEYQRIPQGGTPLSAIRGMRSADLTVELGQLASEDLSAGGWLKAEGVPLRRMNLPIGIRACDAFHFALSEVSGRPVPERYTRDRGRLVDSYVDAHKYIFQKRVAIFADPDMLIGLAGFVAEIGMKPVLLATGAKAPGLEEALRALPHFPDDAKVAVAMDFESLETEVKELRPALAIGSGKGFKMARNSGVPLLRVGFPIHDRFGASRVRHIGYEGTQDLFDRIVNSVLESRQNRSSVGWTYF